MIWNFAWWKYDTERFSVTSCLINFFLNELGWFWKESRFFSEPPLLTHVAIITTWCYRKPFYWVISYSNNKNNLSWSRMYYASESPQSRVTKVFFFHHSLANLTTNWATLYFHKFVLLCICWDTPSITLVFDNDQTLQTKQE